MAVNAGEIVAHLTLDTAAWDAEIKRVTKQANRLNRKAAGMIPFLKDLFERVAMTFLAAFASTIATMYISSGLGANIADVNAWEKVLSAAVIAGGSAVFTLVKSGIARKVTGTASLASPAVPAAQPVVAAKVVGY